MNVLSNYQLTPTESLRSCGRLAFVDDPRKDLEFKRRVLYITLLAMNNTSKFCVGCCRTTLDLCSAAIPARYVLPVLFHYKLQFPNG